ncbi:hypothetical protein ACZ90_00340 [Streptomyces albus subsp. albus]|nr:hypothetical protein ACZ90_00340 [Streptomyces albus subsp. albus]
MDWFTHLGNMAALIPDSPGLAWDFALLGAEPDLVGYDLAYGLQATPTSINLYPAEETPLGLPVEETDLGDDVIADGEVAQWA